ncbi:MAG TPA: universal stress protein [Actinophytocola sp.]|uniref:universal stress protein n=1 Tax=Actinophytocola sp. TaxID=1872138 RepID=UPI002DBB6EFA|nr:universal stress protein [Actinophytocola sp.]HEU5470881.1 universal stress protein [Actinophytocola sp.]
MTTTSPIVVGVDGSDSALHAVRWAAREAELRNAPLRLVHVCTVVPPGYVNLPGHGEVLVDRCRQWLRQAADAARAVADPVEIVTELRAGVIAKGLIEESAGARMVVLGSRGLGGFTELLVGPIAVTVAAHAHSPVVVVRPPGTRTPPVGTGPVVVGVDGSPTSEAAVAFAFEAAALRGVPLLAVHTWLDVDYTGAWIALPSLVDWAAVRADAQRLLAERLTAWQEKFPTVEVHRIVEQDRPARALLAHAKDAQLIVVGSRGRGAWTGLGLGSVSHTLLHHAPCPVAVVRPEQS